MNQDVITIMFSLIRSAVFNIEMTEKERNLFSESILGELIDISRRQDISHLIAYGLRKNSLLPKDDKNMERIMLKAVFRYEQLNHEFAVLCGALEMAEIPFIPLKGSVLCKYYPEPWMRTRCDIDILVRHDDLENAISYLVQNHRYELKGRATHDVSLLSPNGNCVELHYDLVEEGRANGANDVLQTVWENVSLRNGCAYWYEMTDEFFYFYHIAHMAKHFESGGCGVRPFIDLWILDNTWGMNQSSCDDLLEKGDLLQFANAARKLSMCWIDGEEFDALSKKFQDYILHGGVYGSVDNRVALNQQKRGGRFGYMLSRVFIPYAKLRRYYPVLEKHRWLTPVMQVRRWFMLLEPGVARRSKTELTVNGRIEKSVANEMKRFLDDIGIK